MILRVAKPASIQFVGTGSPPRVAPFGLSWSDTGEALAIQLATDSALDDIPEAATLPPRTLVIVLPDGARGRGLLAAFGKKSLSRAARCGALLVREYVAIGAELDPVSRLDLVFARTP